MYSRRAKLFNQKKKKKRKKEKEREEERKKFVQMQLLKVVDIIVVDFAMTVRWDPMDLAKSHVELKNQVSP